MIERPFWIDRIEAAWKEAPIAWLSGVRRSGKTTLALSLGEERVHYVNRDLPVAEDMVHDPALFYRHCPKPVVVFDEIHQLRDPSRVLKIGADMSHYPKGRNYLMTPHDGPAYVKRVRTLEITVALPNDFGLG